jgi:hypothetical protein
MAVGEGRRLVGVRIHRDGGHGTAVRSRGAATRAVIKRTASGRRWGASLGRKAGSRVEGRGRLSGEGGNSTARQTAAQSAHSSSEQFHYRRTMALAEMQRRGKESKERRHSNLFSSRREGRGGASERWTDSRSGAQPSKSGQPDVGAATKDAAQGPGARFDSTLGWTGWRGVRPRKTEASARAEKAPSAANQLLSEQRARSGPDTIVDCRATLSSATGIT